ncbi:MAG: hypothetical protein JNJ50_26435 [Acidobacteria bacterium]|nr:hypothetical protein [Acidobacteriota bacterium]
MSDIQTNRANPSKQAEIVYQSAPSEPDDDFWLEQANKLIVESLPVVREAAKSLMTGLGALQGIYLGMLGFAKFIPESAQWWEKAMFFPPLLCWMMGLYQCLKVAKTEELRLYRNAPADIRQKLGDLAKEKQRELDLAFYWMLGGLAAAFLLVALRMKMTG